MPPGETQHASRTQEAIVLSRVRRLTWHPDRDLLRRGPPAGRERVTGRVPDKRTARSPGIIGPLTTFQEM